MSGGNAEQEFSEAQKLRKLAQLFRDLAGTRAGRNEDAILGLVRKADEYADRICSESSQEVVDALTAEAQQEQKEWMNMMGPLASAVEGDLRSTARRLRAVADGGSTAVFGAIGAVASEAEAGLDEFLACVSTHEKLCTYIRIEKSRAGWLTRMEDLHSAVADGSESQAPTEAPDASDPACEEFDEFPEEEACCKPVEERGGSGCPSRAAYRGGYSSFFPPSAGCTVLPTTPAPGESPEVPSSSSADGSLNIDAVVPSVPSPAIDFSAITPDDAREQLKKYLSDKDDGLLIALRKAVADVKADGRFDGVHEDAAKLLEQMELAAGAIIPEALVQNFSEDLSGAEEKLKATVEPMRKAQWGGFYAKKAAFAVQKYDLYKRRGEMPHLKNEHPELLECAKVCVQLAEYLRKEAQNAIMDSVTGLVRQTMTTTDDAAESAS